MKKEFLLCLCGHSDHMIILNFEETGDYVECSMEIHLSPLPFYKRLWRAIKYVCGYRSRYGDFDELIIDRESAVKLRNYFDKAISNKDFH